MDYERNIDYELQLNQKTEKEENKDHGKELVNPIMAYEKMIFDLLEKNEENQQTK